MILDRFQEEAIKHIKNGHSVLVSAPTGAGKTLIAERVIEECIEKNLKAIYTSPIKALSNQKFRDFSKLYGNKVGILTGDVSINPDAEILIMTTEIFRNKILESAYQLAEYGWIIFDEIHYIDDRERGTVWEESIMLMPPHIRILALSATIPNVDELAEWISKVHDVPIHVVTESTRPVPLKVLYNCSNNVHRNIKELDRYRNEFRTPQSGFYNKRKYRYHHSNIAPNRIDTLLEFIEKNGGFPCIYFAFSRSRCEELASTIVTKNFLTTNENKAILKYYDELVENFNLQNERTAAFMREAVSRGVAYHHAGLLPTLKEVIERLFTSRLLKIIFTTETFALGINMPARSVIFDEIRKRYGENFATLRVRDFNQMAGRAGRRGIDEAGFVYLRINPRMLGLEEIKRLMFGKPERVASQFNSGYATILNLYRKYGEKLYDIYPSSFHFHQSNPKRRSEATNHFMQKVKLLKEMGYIDEKGLTEKGQFASEIHGYELPITELYHNDYLSGLSPVALCIIVGSLIYEPRKNQDEPPLSKIARDLKRIAWENANNIKSMERNFKLQLESKYPYFHVSNAIEAFMAGKNFSELFKITSIDEGELVKIFRAIIQVLREISHSPSVSSSLKNTAYRAIEQLNRDVVDAERELRYS